MKSFKLEFDEKVEERLSDVEMKNIAGGIQDEVEVDLFGIRFLCLSFDNWDCKKSRSCKAFPICIPF
jgi:hypothetical protein